VRIERLDERRLQVGVAKAVDEIAIRIIAGDRVLADKWQIAPERNSPLRGDVEFQIRTENDFLGPYRARRAGFVAVSGRGPLFAAYLKEIERSREILAVVFGGAGAVILLRWCGGLLSAGLLKRSHAEQSRARDRDRDRGERKGEPALAHGSIVHFSRVPRHFQTSDEIGVTCVAALLVADAMGLVGRGKCRPFFAEFFPHGLLALDALGERQVRPASLSWILRLLGDASAHRIDVEIGNVVRKSRPTRGQQHGGRSKSHG